MNTKKEKWQIELDAGNIWRAKEILRSIIRWRYDIDIYLAYGKILYDVQDYYEAGKYLFIAGEELDGKYEIAIGLFLKRHQYTDLRQLISNFPNQFIRKSFSEYPLNVQSYMNNRGYKEKDFNEIREENKYVDYPMSLSDKINLGLFLSIFIVPFLVGVWVLLSKIFTIFL